MSSQLLRTSAKLAANTASLARSNIAAAAARPLGFKTAIQLHQSVANISTSTKKSDVTVTADTAVPQGKTRFEEETVVKDKKNWVSYGFSSNSEEEDINSRNLIMFWTVTMALVGTGFQMAYFPDLKLRDWAQREAYIELARREALGLPLVSPDLVDPKNINLPSEEELGDFEIII